jgi:AraC family transcriptional regulator
MPYLDAVERAVTYMWDQYDEPLSLADIARSATLSRFHFSRVFKDATGVTPGQFLAAVRIHQAKSMLAATTMNVADVSVAVGYSSVGSFTNRFTDSVGVSPKRFRCTVRASAQPWPGSPPDPAFRAPSEVTGVIRLPGEWTGGPVYVGVFDSAIIQRRPEAAVLLGARSPGPHPGRFSNIPDGRWYVHAITELGGLVGTAGPVPVSGGNGTFQLILRPRIPTDPPVLLAIPELGLSLVHQ